MRVVTFVLVCAALQFHTFVAADDAAVGDARGAQNKVDDLANEMMQKMMELEKETNKKKVPLFKERNELLKKIDGFWARAFTNHPSHAEWTFGNDRDIFNYISDLMIEDIDPDHHTYKVILTLKQNPYISDEKISRDFNGHDVSKHTTSGVHWLGENRPLGLTFFNFFESESSMEPQTINDIAHHMRYEFFQNPFTYYDLPTFDELAAQHQANAVGAEEEEIPSPMGTEGDAAAEEAKQADF